MRLVSLSNAAKPTAACFNIAVLVLLLLLASNAVDASSRLGAAADWQQKAAKSPSLTQLVADKLHRHLLASAMCPDGCVDTACVSDSTKGGLRCAKCKNNLIISKAEGSCACPAGKYAVAGSDACTDCPKGAWCAGGAYNVTAPPVKQECPTGMTTLGLRSTSSRACVNLPGYSYDVTSVGVPSATLCPANTYGPGFKKQRGCAPCPTGFSTNGLTGQRLPSACVVPAGYYLKAPGQAAPCPQGEWKSDVGPAGNCTKCPWGVTTPKAGATSSAECTVIMAGYYATGLTPSRAITGIGVCPQRYYCPGGLPVRSFDPTDPSALPPSEPTIKLCPDGMWTQELGATTLQQCMTPPGYKTVNGATTMCGDNEYRANWAVAGEATSCSSCGVGVLADKTDRVTMYELVSGNATLIPITTSADDCYIQPGQGLMFSTITSSYRAVNCDTNNYGVTNITYGLTPTPCKPCPQNMITSKDNSTYRTSSFWYNSNADGTGGFISPLACVNQGGYGYNGRVSAPCPQDYYNLKDTYSTCKPCGFGLGTPAPGAGKRREDCMLAPGHGRGTSHYLNESVILCPVGYYNDKYQADLNTPCTACPNGTTTTRDGSTDRSDCDMCLPGWGGPDCATQCGGIGDSASYGPPGRQYGSPCLPCTQTPSSYSFSWMLQNDVWTAKVTSRLGAENAADCLSSYTQVVDGPWYLPITTGGVTTPNVTDFDTCVSLCTAPDCQYVTYDYMTQDCTMRLVSQANYMYAPFVAFKGFTAGVAGASSVESNHTRSNSSNRTVRAKKVDYGQYTIYQDPYGDSIGRQVPAPNAAWFTRMQQCLDACDYDSRCAGVNIQSTVHPGSNVNDVGPKTCKLIYGDSRPGQYKRTVIRTDTTKLEIPVYLRVCRELPDPVWHGNWPVSCRGTPVNGACVAWCDCNPDECYAKVGCPTAICQEDGTWGPPNPSRCELAIPAEPTPISCPTPLRPGIMDTSGAVFTGKRRLLSLPPAPDGRLEAAHRLAPRSPRDATKDRSLLWAPGSSEFQASWSYVGLLCPQPGYNYSQPYAMMPDGYGEVVVDNFLCHAPPMSPVIGIAAQDFVKTWKNKFENISKSYYESYVWTYFNVADLPDPEATITQVQGLQLMVVGNVGVDHPCFATCSVTAVDVALYNDNGGQPGDLYYDVRVNLRLNETFSWNNNETAVLNLDVQEYSGVWWLEDNANYWLRLKLIVPYNGTDGSGDARCYGHIALSNTTKDADHPPMWQEKGGYNTACTGTDSSTFPTFTQSVSACTNGGVPGAAGTEYCDMYQKNKTCNWGCPTFKCPVASQDIVYSLYGFQWLGGLGGARR